VRVFVSPGTWSTKTAEAYADDVSYTGPFCAATADRIYVGFKRRFAMIRFLKDGGAFAVGAGSLIAQYFNGTAFVPLSGLADGTAVGGNTLAQNGLVSWQIPADWALRGNANLDADKYYVEISLTNAPSTPPSADILAPVDGQYFEVAFSQMDFQGPSGRPRREEVIQLNRGKVDGLAHYVKGPDGRLYEPLEVAFSCALDDAANKAGIEEALDCGNPGTALWSAAGLSTKGLTRNEGASFNPVFADPSKKAVNLQMLFEAPAGEPAQGWAYYETLCPGDWRKVDEGEGGVILSCRAACYGVVERIHAIANRY